MFSLVVTIISIALVTALALATIYYGGSAFRQGKNAAFAAQLINEGQQINGAVALSDAEGRTPAALADLAPTYLQSIPQGWTLNVSGDLRTALLFQRSIPAGNDRADICQKINEKAGFKASMTSNTSDNDSNLVVLPGDIFSNGTKFGCRPGVAATIFFVTR